MPGTIQVSVVDFMGLHSSLPQSQMCIKVSLGKREYITWDKGELSFPVTTLRNDLVITLQDAEGNEISRTGVQTKLVIEKGFWDDIFPLEGGGYVHMKLLFVLSDEDRNRIRKMREAALKKKLDKLLNSSESENKNAPVVAQLHPEVSDSRILLPVELATKSVNFENQNKKSRDRNETTSNDTDIVADVSNKGLLEKTKTTLTTGDVSSEETSVMLKISESPIVANKSHARVGEEVSGEKPEIVLMAIDVPVRNMSSEEGEKHPESLESDFPARNAPNPPKPEEGEPRDSIKQSLEENSEVTLADKVSLKDISSEEALPSTGLSESDFPARNAPNPPKPEGGEARDSDKQNSEEKIEVTFADKVPWQDGSSDKALSSSGGIRSTIAAQNNPVPPKPEDSTDHEKPTSLKKSPSNVRKMISAFEGSRAQDTRPSIRSPPKKFQSNRVGVEAPLASPHKDEFKARKSSGRIVSHFLASKSQQTEQLNKLGAETQSIGTNPGLNKKAEEKEKKTYPETSATMPAVEVATVLGRISIPDDHVAAHQASTLSTIKQDSGGSIGRLDSGRIDQREFKNFDIPRVSINNLQSVSNNEGYRDCVETSGAWIFPDEERKLCVTTGDKRAIDLMGGWQNKANTTIFRASEKFQDSMQGESEANVNEGEKASHGPKKPKPESNGDDENGLFGQAIKVAIVTAFGILVLLTRHR